MTAGKGSKQRPTDKQKFDEAFDRIFRPLCTECGKRQDPGQIHTCLQHPKRYYHTAEISLSTTK